MSHFAKRHYEAIARVMQRNYAEYFGNGDAHDRWWRTCVDLANMFEDDTPLFDRICFLKACEPGANVKARTKASPLPKGVTMIGLDNPAELHNTLKRTFGE